VYFTYTADNSWTLPGHLLSWNLIYWFPSRRDSFCLHHWMQLNMALVIQRTSRSAAEWPPRYTAVPFFLWVCLACRSNNHVSLHNGKLKHEFCCIAASGNSHRLRCKLPVSNNTSPVWNFGGPICHLDFHMGLLVRHAKTKKNLFSTKHIYEYNPVLKN